MERIVITGMGTVNALGMSVNETWNNLIRGVSGAAPITLFDASTWNAKIACEVKNFDPTQFMDFKEVRRRDRFEQLGVAAARETLQSSGLEINDATAERIGVVISSGVGGLRSLQENIYALQNEGLRKVSPFAIPMLMPNGAAGMVGIDYGLRGPSFAVASACASSADSLGVASMMLHTGMVDAVLAGGADATITEIGIGAFDRATAISRNPDPACAPRPFDKNRDGFVMGEGSALLVLETESHARKRGANIFAELASYGATADANHVIAPREDATGSAGAMRIAMKNAGINPDEVGYINAHGTATQLNDVLETKAIKLVFGEQAYNIPISSTKSMTGHMMGSTAALEVIFSVMAIREGILPPTINYETPDPDCDLDYIPNKAREKKVDVVVSNAFGFGGHNSVLVLRRYAG